MNDEEEEAIVTIDGRGELGGYANYADNTVANATVADVIRTVQEMNTGAGNALDVGSDDCGRNGRHTRRA